MVDCTPGTGYDKGANHSVVEVVAQEMIILGGPKEMDGSDQADDVIPEDEYPF